MKVSIVTTVLNEEKTIDAFLDSVAGQIKKPDEVIVVDGGSVDWTVEKMQKKGLDNLNLRIIIEPGANRSQGRNIGAKKATGEILAFTDAGCILDKNWLQEITKPFSDPKVKLVSGYYKGKAKNTFEKCVIPYVLVMPDKVNPNNFYPASRSMAIRKEVFWQFGGFPENFSDNEDFVFAQRLISGGIKPFFAQKAIVEWLPRSNLHDFWKMIFRFARGDAMAGLRKLKVASVYTRYLLFLFLFFSFLFFHQNFYLKVLFFSFFLYLVWSIVKNYRYVRQLKAFFWLPVLQITSDFAVMIGSLKGCYHKIKNEKNSSTSFRNHC